MRLTTEIITSLSLQGQIYTCLRIVSIFDNPSVTPDFKPTAGTLITALSSTFSTGVPWPPATSSPLENTTITCTSIQKGVIDPTDNLSCWWCWTEATVILGPFLFMFLYVLRYLLQLLVEPGETFLHGFHCLVNSELNIIYDLQTRKRIQQNLHTKQFGSHYLYIYITMSFLLIDVATVITTMSAI